MKSADTGTAGAYLAEGGFYADQKGVRLGTGPNLWVSLGVSTDVFHGSSEELRGLKANFFDGEGQATSNTWGSNGRDPLLGGSGWQACSDPNLASIQQSAPLAGNLNGPIADDANFWDVRINATWIFYDPWCDVTLHGFTSPDFAAQTRPAIRYVKVTWQQQLVAPSPPCTNRSDNFDVLIHDLAAGYVALNVPKRYTNTVYTDTFDISAYNLHNVADISIRMHPVDHMFECHDRAVGATMRFFLNSIQFTETPTPSASS
jgi:hypothetical protein